MNIKATLVLKKGKEVSLKRLHPWVFSGAILSIEGKPNEGDWICVTSFDKQILGYGHYHSGTITVRILYFNEEHPGNDFWNKKMKASYAQRKSIGIINDHTNAYRLVHGEGDGLSGLIIDMYNGAVVIQAHSVGMYRDREQIISAIKEIFPDKLSSVYLKNTSTHKHENENKYLLGAGVVPHIINEYGNKFYVDWESGQKTGFFLDQRENRKLLSDFVATKRVLNAFCYTGGFSVYALRAGASLVHSVDASEKAIDLARKNIELNGFDSDHHACYSIDTFEFIKDKKDEYDVIVLDPPAFAKHKSARHQAMKGYQRLNAEAIRIVRKGGLIFTFSCSQVISRQLFYDTIVSAAIQAGREVKVLHHLSQPADHPVSIYHPEGEYLKGLVLYVS